MGCANDYSAWSQSRNHADGASRCCGSNYGSYMIVFTHRAGRLCDGVGGWLLQGFPVLLLIQVSPPSQFWYLCTGLSCECPLESLNASHESLVKVFETNAVSLDSCGIIAEEIIITLQIHPSSQVFVLAIFQLKLSIFPLKF